jgi:hypothetical protein
LAKEANMKIGIDIHGTIDWDPEYWRKTIMLLQTLGHQIYIVSGPTEEEIARRLENFRIEPNDLYIESVVDFLTEKGTPHWYKDDNFWTDNDSWFRAKFEICYERGIDVLIDNQGEYFKPQSSPDTKFILYQRGRFVPA